VPAMIINDTRKVNATTIKDISQAMKANNVESILRTPCMLFSDILNIIHLAKDVNRKILPSLV
jgi:hypothetical protein